MRNKLSLDVDSPYKVAPVLTDAAQTFRESAEELRSAWQSRQAGHVWDLIAKELDAAAGRIALHVKKVLG